MCQCCLLYKTLVGAQMRYAVHDRNGWPLAMLGFSTAAWKLAPRDHFIGWTPQMREKNLSLVVDNPRFLILPWIEIPNLGSHILAIVRRRLPEDWTERYNTTPVLIEALASDCYSILRGQWSPGQSDEDQALGGTRDFPAGAFTSCEVGLRLPRAIDSLVVDGTSIVPGHACSSAHGGSNNGSVSSSAIST